MSIYILRSATSYNYNDFYIWNAFILIFFFFFINVFKRRYEKKDSTFRCIARRILGIESPIIVVTSSNMTIYDRIIVDHLWPCNIRNILIHR